MQSITAFSYTIQARQLASTGSFSRAFDLYIGAFYICPELKNRVESEFRRLLTKFNEFLLTVSKIGDIFYNFERAIDCYPGNVYILNEIGTFLFKFGYVKEACCHFQKALNSDVGFVAAEKNLNSIKNYMVEHWHFRMLNDKVRNNAYRRALKKAIVPMRETILDLGTGTGLLAMYANQCMPMMITACDCSEIMTEMATSVFEENNIEDIVLVSKMSHDMNYRDIGGKRSLIITELFDAGLFGEGVLQTLIHARSHLMAENGRIMPKRAEMFLVGVQCDFLHSRYRLSKAILQFLNLKGSNVHVLNSEPYDCEDVVCYDDLKYVTKVQSLLKVDFNNSEEMAEKLSEDSRYEVSLMANEAGEINALVSWFDLYLTEDVMITTNPQDSNRAHAWQQAIFYNFVPFPVEENDSIDLHFTSADGKLKLLHEPQSAMYISAEVLRFLNDSEYIRLIENTTGAVCIYLGQIINVSRLNALDLNPFPVLGLLMLRRGAQSLTCCAKTTEDRDFIIHVFETNGIPESKVTILMKDELDIDMFKDQRFHLIYNNIIDLNGDVNSKLKELSDHLKVNCLAPGGLVLPHQVIVEGQLVSSVWLERSNQVDDANTGLKVASFINKYQVSHNLHLDIAHLEYKALSDVTVVANYTDGLASDVLNVKVTCDGDIDAILVWYKIQLIEEGPSITTDRENGFVDSMAFIANPKVAVKRGETGNVLRCVDADESFKLLIDVE